MENLNENQILISNDPNDPIDGEISTTDKAICIGMLILYLGFTILTIVYFNNNKTSDMSKSEIIKKNGLFVLLMVIFGAGIFSSMFIGNTTEQILYISGLLCAIGLSTNGIFYLVL